MLKKTLGYWVSGLVCSLGLMASSGWAMQLPAPGAETELVGEVQVIKASYEDTFADLGNKYHLGYLEMVAANPGVDAWLPGAGKEITLPTRFILPSGEREGIVINLAEYRLYFFPKNSPYMYSYPLGIGREGWSSPVADTRITVKTPNPGWTPPKSILKEHAENGDPLPAYVPPGPDNPLGPYKMTLALPGYLIHGSNKNFGIGMRVSHGCFRMLNHNVLELADMVATGEKVRIINQPYKLGIEDGKLYLEAHEPLEDDNLPSIVDRQAAVARLLLEREDLQDRVHIDWERLRQVVAEQSGIPEVVGELL